MNLGTSVNEVSQDKTAGLAAYLPIVSIAPLFFVNDEKSRGRLTQTGPRATDRGKLR